MSGWVAGFGGALAHGSRPAVVVVDAILGFTDPRRPLGAAADDVVGAMAVVLQRARAGGHPILFTTLAFEPGLADAGIWPAKIPALADLIIGSAAVEVDGRLGRRDSEPLIVKKGPSAVYGTNLLALLAARRCDTVVL